jgi:hypothetical protein
MKLKLFTLMAAAAIPFWGCSETADNPGASNNNGDASISGIAAYGYAADGASVEITDAEGNVLFEGTCGADGSFEANVEGGRELPLLVRTNINDSLELTSLINDEDDYLDAGDDLEALVNPVTDLAVRRLLGDELNRARLREINRERFMAEGDSVALRLLGEGSEFAPFYSDADFIPARRGDRNVQPSVSDMVLHTLGDRALRAERPLRDYLDGAVNEEARLLERDEAFRLNLAANLNEYEIALDEMQSQLQFLMAENAELQAELEELRALLAPPPGAETLPPELEGIRLEMRHIIMDHFLAVCPLPPEVEPIAIMDELDDAFAGRLALDIQSLEARIDEEGLTPEDWEAMHITAMEYAEQMAQMEGFCEIPEPGEVIILPYPEVDPWVEWHDPELPPICEDNQQAEPTADGRPSCIPEDEIITIPECEEAWANGEECAPLPPIDPIVCLDGTLPVISDEGAPYCEPVACPSDAELSIDAAGMEYCQPIAPIDPVDPIVCVDGSIPSYDEAGQATCEPIEIGDPDCGEGFIPVIADDGSVTCEEDQVVSIPACEEEWANGEECDPNAGSETGSDPVVAL